MSLEQMLMKYNNNNILFNNNLPFIPNYIYFGSNNNISYLYNDYYSYLKSLENIISFNPIIHNPYTKFNCFGHYDNLYNNQFNTINNKANDNINYTPQNNYDWIGTLPDNSIKNTSKLVFTTKKKGLAKNFKKIHGADAKDNIMKKIQVHFLSFIVNYTNDVINSLIKDKHVPRFKSLAYEIKRFIRKKYLEELKTKTIGEILQFQVTTKTKNSDKNINKNIYKIIYEKYPCLQNFFKKTFLELFKQYFNNKNKIFFVNGQLIQISQKTQTLNDLMEKYYSYKEKIKNIAIKYYLNCYKMVKKPIFKTSVVN